MRDLINIRDFEAYSQEGKDWTEAFRQAVSKAAEQGGGLIWVPAGTYPTHSIELKSHMTLYVGAGARLNFMEDIENYEAVTTEFEGNRTETYMPCVYARKAEYVGVKGEGIMDGRGEVWWKAVKEKRPLGKGRPCLICFQECDHVRLEGVTLLNSPAWTVHPLYCDDVVIQGITIKNPADSPNTDGINPDSCRNVRIINCRVDVGDDCITLKSGTEKTGRRIPCENIVVADCNLLHGHGGLVIGSEMSGGVRNVTVTNCVFQDTDRGIRMKTKRRRGGVVENIHLNNIVMDRVICPFVFNMYYYCGPEGRERYVWDKEAYPLDESTPAFRNICISNMTVTDASAAAGFIYGLKEQPVRGVSFSNVSITMSRDGKPGSPAMMGNLKPMSGEGFFLRNAQDILFENVKIHQTRGNVWNVDESVDFMVK